MCGRYCIDIEDEAMQEIIDAVNRRVVQKYPKSDAIRVATGEIFPSQIAPVFIRDRGQIAPVAMRWGFWSMEAEQNGRTVRVPWDGTDGQKPRQSINAKQETAAVYPLWAQSLRSRRAVIPSSGFFEWKHEAPKKTGDKYLFTEPGKKRLYMAGLWHLFQYKDLLFPHYVILTTKPNESMLPFHDRMPVLLEENEMAGWLSGEDTLALLKRPQAALAAEGLLQ